MRVSRAAQRSQGRRPGNCAVSTWGTMYGAFGDSVAPSEPAAERIPATRQRRDAADCFPSSPHPRFHRLAGQRSRAPGAACHARARVALILAPESAVDRFAREHPTQLGLTLRASTPRYHCCVVADEIDIPAAPKAPRNSAAGSAVCDGPCAAHSARDQWGHAKPRVSRRESEKQTPGVPGAQQFSTLKTSLREDGDKG